MAKASRESRIPMFGSRIPKLGKFSFLPKPLSRSEDIHQIESCQTTETVKSEELPASLPQSVSGTPTTDGSEVLPSDRLKNTTFVKEVITTETTFVKNDVGNETVLMVKHITTDDVGKRVCVKRTEEQTGVLKYVGPVHFNADLWCGVELDSMVGKHDGCVKGVRYFTCRAGCGVMAPVDKVFLVNSVAEHENVFVACDTTIEVISSEQQCVSGPYSLLGIETCASDSFCGKSSCNKTLADSTQSAEDANSQDESVSSHFRRNQRSLFISSSTAILSNIAHLYTSSPYEDLCQPGSSTPIIKDRNKRKFSTLGTASPDDHEANVAKYFFSKEEDVSSASEGNITKKIPTPITSPVETPSFPKQSSFEMEESLGILTPDEMNDFSQSTTQFKTPLPEDLAISNVSDKTISNSRTPSSENLGSIPYDGFKLPLPSKEQNLYVKDETLTPPVRPDCIDLKNHVDVLSSNKTLKTELSSPNLIDSTVDFSLGLLHEDLMVSGKNTFPMTCDMSNLILPLDSTTDGKQEILSRSDQTPSPEDLPLDPIDPKMELLDSSSSDTKTEPSNKYVPTTKANSFITSITSITSLDTGYQGDGEMSRPASRGADHSPIAHKPNNPVLVNMQWQRAITRRQDPMTDSDFFTESDADVHDEAVSRGDRRAQVIDGTLYGANVQAAAAAAEIYVNNHEEMESSGIFTDLDTNPRTDDFSDGEKVKDTADIFENDDKSPSDISSKTISENSQEFQRGQEEMELTLVNEAKDLDTPQEVHANPVEERPLNSPIHNAKSNPETINESRTRAPQENRKPIRKKVGRWDAVMNKISKGQEIPKSKVLLTEVKSKVSTGIKGPPKLTTKRSENIKSEDVTKSKVRRVRPRTDSVLSGSKTGNSKTGGSIHSSVSDLSVGASTVQQPSKRFAPNRQDQVRTKLHEVKSKVATGIKGPLKTTSKRIDDNKSEGATTSKLRKVLSRTDNILLGTKSNSRTASSIHSSASDLSVGLSHVQQSGKHVIPNRATKKRVTLTPAGTRPTPFVTDRKIYKQHLTSEPITDLKKSPVQPPASRDGKASVGRQTPSRRTIGATADLKTPTTKDQSRVTGTLPHKGGSPVRPQIVPERDPVETLLPHVKHSAKGVEALGVLVQYLVFNLEAFRGPSLKRELEQVKSKWLKDKLDLEETRMGYRKLEDVIVEQKLAAAEAIERERVQYRSEITELFEKHRRDVIELNEKNAQEKLELERRLQEENSELKNQIDDEISNKENEIRIRIEAYAEEQKYKRLELEQKNERLKQENQIALEILREENDSIREQLDEKVLIIQDLEELQFRNERLKNEFSERERLYEEKFNAAEDEIATLKEENRKILETFKSDTKDNKLQAALGRCAQLQDEVESLRSVLDLKLAELSELRRAHGELVQAAEELPAALVRCQSLQARTEDLELQIARKTDMELHLTEENKRLTETCFQETKEKKRLMFQNDELKFKLEHNRAVTRAILRDHPPSCKSIHGLSESLCDEVSYRAPNSTLSRSLHTSSFNEKHQGTPLMFERSLSFRERSTNYKDTRFKNAEEKNNSKISESFYMNDSPPSSPKVKAVVEKNDSVSWVLDMDEPPEVLASRMIRRSGICRNVISPKSTPAKSSSASKRPRTKSNNSLSLSASTGAIISPVNKNNNRHRSKSVSMRDTQSPEHCHPEEFLCNSWHYNLHTSTPAKPRSFVKLENNLDLEHDTDVAISLPALPSEINRKMDVSKPDSLPSLPSADILLLQSFPKNSGGEAMISESNSEDDCSSSTGERSPSVSDTETSEDPVGK